MTRYTIRIKSICVYKIVYTSYMIQDVCLLFQGPANLQQKDIVGRVPWEQISSTVEPRGEGGGGGGRGAAEEVESETEKTK